MTDAVSILGTGAMAGLFGGRLARHATVTLLGSWKEGLGRLGAAWKQGKLVGDPHSGWASGR